MLLDYLGYGKANAVTRERLAALSGMDDRAVRDNIKRLREDGVLVCNDGDGRGYYLAEKPEEANRLIAAYTRRTRTMERTRGRMIKNAKDIGQVSV